MRLLATLTLLPILTAAASAAAADRSPACFNRGNGGPIRSPCAVATVFQQEALKLRAEAQAQAAADGGALSPEHRAAVRAEMDDLIGRYRRQMRNSNPFSVNGTGRPETDPFAVGRAPNVLPGR